MNYAHRCAGCFPLPLVFNLDKESGSNGHPEHSMCKTTHSVYLGFSQSLPNIYYPESKLSIHHVGF